jgi:hypothetical protein
MDITLLILGIFVAVSVYFDKKLGIIVGLLLLVFMVDYPVKVKDTDDTMKTMDMKCSDSCNEVVEDKLVCQADCLKNLKSILK